MNTLLPSIFWLSTQRFRSIGAVLLLSLSSFSAGQFTDPVISASTPVNTDEDIPKNVTISITDAEDASSALTVEFISSTNPGLLPVGNITASSPFPVLGTPRVYTVSPVTNQYGSATITVRVTDTDDDFAITNFVVNVSAVNDDPVLSPIPNKTLQEDVPGTVVLTYADVEGPFSQLTLSYASNNPGLLPVSSISTNSSNGSTTTTISLLSLTNLYGDAQITVTLTDTGGLTDVETFDVTVEPVNDLPTISGDYWGEGAGNSIVDFAETNIFTELVVADVDHPTSNQTLIVTITAPSDSNTYGLRLVGNPGLGIDDDLVGQLQYTGTPGAVTTWLDTQKYKPQENTVAVGQTSVVQVTVAVVDQDSGPASKTDGVNVESMNDAPAFALTAGPARDAVTAPYSPYLFFLIQDLDINDTFTMTMTPVSTNVYGTFSQSPLTFSGTKTQVQDAITGLLFDPNEAIISGSVSIPYTFSLEDAGGLTVAYDVSFEVIGENQNPVIFGINTDVQTVSDTATNFTPFASITILDEDFGGLQPVSIDVTVDDPAYGAINNLQLPNSNSPLVATDLARSLIFIPDTSSMAIGEDRTVVLTIVVTDSGGKSATNSATRVSFTNRNDPPQIAGVPSAGNQPVLLLPDPPINPFSGISITNDDTNSVRVEVELDDPLKGTFTNLGGAGGFTQAGDVYEMEGSIASISVALQALAFNVSTEYVFPANAPGGTVFTIRAIDDDLQSDVATLSVLVQDLPRNWCVTSTDDSMDPGTLRFAIENAENNDVVTFALDTYTPSRMIRLSSPLVINRNVRIRGPGANLLTISGDTNGNGLPNVRVFDVRAAVEIDGVTISHGTELTGGAIFVNSRGDLRLKNTVIRDSVASQWGGAIDVSEGRLKVEQCLFYNNRTDENLGRGGGAISLYTDQGAVIQNSTFAENQQQASSGDGGGAIFIENSDPFFDMIVEIDGCTFHGNRDASAEASAVLGTVFGTRINARNSIFNDQAGRNLYVESRAVFFSEGGNLCDDSSRVPTTVGGTPDFTLLDFTNDKTNSVTDVEMLDLTLIPTGGYRLKAGSAAVTNAVAGGSPLDQHGGIRGSHLSAGALQYPGAQRLVINEIQAKGEPTDFIEIYVQRDSLPIDLSGVQLLVTGVVHHVFALDTILEPGFGIIVGDEGSLSSVTNIPVVTPLLALNLPARGEIQLRSKPPFNEVVLSMDYVDIYVNLMNTDQNEDYDDNSMTLVPQFSGSALLPHSMVLAPPYGGADKTRDDTANLSSPGKDSGGTPFGQDNAEPVAGPDTFLTLEDSPVLMNVLANDFDADGNDRLHIVDLNNALGDTGSLNDLVLTLSNTSRVEVMTTLEPFEIEFDPRSSTELQSLPLGAQQPVTFAYSVIDFGEQAISDVIDSVSGLWGSTPGVVVIESPSHRLTDNTEIEIFGTDGYDGTYLVTNLTNDYFRIDKAYAGVFSGAGSWKTTGPREPSNPSETSVTVTVLGVNDVPTPASDSDATTEDLVHRIFGDSALVGSNTVFATDSDYPHTPIQSSINLLGNDSDPDTDDTAATLRLYGVVDGVSVIGGYASSSNSTLVEAVGHGLGEGDRILISGYAGHPSYTDSHLVSIVDTNHFLIPVPFVDNNSTSGVFAVLTEAGRFQAVSPWGAEVRFEPRADRIEESIVYNPLTSTNLNALGENESAIDVFYVAVQDRHGAVALAEFSMTVQGVNDLPIAIQDPGNLSSLFPLMDDDADLRDFVDQLEILFALPQEGTNGWSRAWVEATNGPTRVELVDLFTTDEDTAIDISDTVLLMNDLDVDTSDDLEIISVSSTSRYGAVVTLSPDGRTITYDPDDAERLEDLVREELLLDTFEVVINDIPAPLTPPFTVVPASYTAPESITSVVAVLVVGLNDTPVGGEDLDIGNEDTLFEQNLLTRIPTVRPDFDADINGEVPDNELQIIPAVDQTSDLGAPYLVNPTNLVFDPTSSALFNELAVGQSLTDRVDVAFLDSSFVFANDDEFKVAADGADYELDVLANDRKLYELGGTNIFLVEVGTPNAGGSASIVDGKVVYTPLVNFVGTEYLPYRIEDLDGHSDWGLISVRATVDRLNGNLVANSDLYTVAKGESPLLPVLVNDHIRGTAGLTISRILEQPAGDLVEIEGSSIRFRQLLSSPSYTTTFKYELSAGGTARAEAVVTVHVIDRADTLNVNPDEFALPIDSFDQPLDVLSNDRLIPESSSAYSIEPMLIETTQYGSVTVEDEMIRYTPAPGFIGTDRFAYMAVDGRGGSGTTDVAVVVGALTPQDDFAGVSSVETSRIDVLSNDVVLPVMTGTIELVELSLSNSVIGTLSIDAGRDVIFIGNGVAGVETLTYTIRDQGMPPRYASATLEVTSLASGLRANSDVLAVLADGSDYSLDVLANDRLIPAEPGRALTVVSASAPSRGGAAVVSPSGGSIQYTPLSGFVGSETFTYIMSDSRGTASASVIVNVSDGTLVPATDAFTVYFEVEESGTVSFDLPVLLNDSVLPDFGQFLNVTGVGINDLVNGDNDPSVDGLVEIAPGGAGIRYTPRGTNPPFDEFFTYEVSDGQGELKDAFVRVRVLQRTNIQDAVTHDDRFYVEADSLSNLLPVLSNDDSKPGTPTSWAIDQVGDTLHGGQVVISGQALLYTPVPGFVGEDSFTYSVNDGLSGTGMATVRVNVGHIPLCRDLFTVLSGSVDNRLPVLENDRAFPAEQIVTQLVGAVSGSLGGGVSFSGDELLYTPSSIYTGRYPYVETVFYTVENDSSHVLTGRVDVAVHEQGSDRTVRDVYIIVEGRNDIPVIDTLPRFEEITDKESTYPLAGQRIIEVDQQRQELLCVRVELDDPDKGLLVGPSAFTKLSADTYEICGVTASNVSPLLSEFLFTPTENRIPVPLVETTLVQVTVTDAQLASTNSAAHIGVQSVNDSPQILGTRGDLVRYISPIYPFGTVTILDPDNLGMQLLDVTVSLDHPEHGGLENLGRFTAVTSGVIRATGLTPAEVTADLRQILFLTSGVSIGTNAPLISTFEIAVDDAFPSPVLDANTVVTTVVAASTLPPPLDPRLRRDLGSAVALEGDFAVVATPEVNTFGQPEEGVSVVYEHMGGTFTNWVLTQILPPVTNLVYGSFGDAVSLNGGVLAIGSPAEGPEGNNEGAVYILERSGGGTGLWERVVQLVATNSTGRDEFGFSVALDGTTLAVGAPGQLGSGSQAVSGVVYVFERASSGSNQWDFVTKLRAIDGDQANARFGHSVAVSGDRIVVGSPQRNVGTPLMLNAGAIYTYDRSLIASNGWSSASIVTASEPSEGATFGESVALEGARLAVSRPTELVDPVRGRTGFVDFFEFDTPSNAWNHVQALVAGDDYGDQFGKSLALDGRRLLVGAPLNYSPLSDDLAARRGRIYLFEELPGTTQVWTRVRIEDCPDPEVGRFGFSLDLDGARAVVGAVDNVFLAQRSGTAYFFNFDENRPPFLSAPISDQLAVLDSPYQYVVPFYTFGDHDVGDSLTLTGVISPLTGLNWSNETSSVEGIPTVLGELVVDLTVTDEGGQQATEQFSIFVVIDPDEPLTPRLIWELNNFGNSMTNPLLSTTLWGEQADADGDGSNNDQEYLFGGDPNVLDSIGIVLLPGPGDLKQIVYVRRSDDPTVDYRVQGTASLLTPNWAMANVLGESVNPIDEHYELVMVTVDPNAPAVQNHFRVLVSPASL